MPAQCGHDHIEAMPARLPSASGPVFRACLVPRRPGRPRRPCHRWPARRVLYRHRLRPSPGLRRTGAGFADGIHHSSASGTAPVRTHRPGRRVGDVHVAR